MDNSTLRCIAKVGFYDVSLSTCPSCPINCKSCISLTSCTACKGGFFMYIDNLCYTKCPDRYYFDSLALNCQPCPYDCQTCDNNGNCITCSYNVSYRALSSSKVRCLPASGYYDNLTHLATPCPEGC